MKDENKQASITLNVASYPSALALRSSFILHPSSFRFGGGV